MCFVGPTLAISAELASLPRAAIARKMQAMGMTVSSGAFLNFWRRQLTHQIEKLNGQRYRAMVMDCDGTLWDSREEISQDAIRSIEALVRNGVVVGIATGRDARVAIRLKQIFDPGVHQQFWIGCENGGQVFRLSEPVESCDEPCAEIQSVRRALERDPFLGRFVKPIVSQYQLTIGCSRLFSREALLRIANTYANSSGTRGIRVVAASNSVDILASGVSKLNVRKPIQRMGIQPDEMLFIGDQGTWPGNDFEILNQPYSLSSGEPSSCSSCGWNLAPQDCQGAEATAFYLRCSSPAGLGCFRLALPLRAW